MSPYYVAEVQSATATIADTTQKSKALRVANIPTFTWLDVIAKTSQLGTYLADASAKGRASGQKYLVEIVVYDLPDRDCSALASNGEFSIANNGLNNYKTYIDQLVAQIKRRPPLYSSEGSDSPFLNRIHRRPYCGGHRTRFASKPGD